MLEAQQCPVHDYPGAAFAARDGAVRQIALVQMLWIIGHAEARSSKRNDPICQLRPRTIQSNRTT